eukprot:1202501-Prymnesium_polylepis.1
MGEEEEPLSALPGEAATDTLCFFAGVAAAWACGSSMLHAGHAQSQASPSKLLCALARLACCRHSSPTWNTLGHKAHAILRMLVPGPPHAVQSSS